MTQPPKLTDEQCKKLFDLANQYSDKVYPPNESGYYVALLTKSGNMYPGASYRSNTETLTMHSEAVALANAALHGETEITAITGPNCHICKQLIYESALRSNIDTLIILEDGPSYKQLPITTLMPLPWPEK